MDRYPYIDKEIQKRISKAKNIDELKDVFLEAVDSLYYKILLIEDKLH